MSGGHALRRMCLYGDDFISCFFESEVIPYIQTETNASSIHSFAVNLPLTHERLRLPCYLFSRHTMTANTAGTIHARRLPHIGIVMPFATISTLNISLNRCAIAISINNITVMVVAGFMRVTSLT